MSRAAVGAEVEKLVRHVADFLRRNGVFVPELTVKTPHVEIQLTFKWVTPGADRDKP